MQELGKRGITAGLGTLLVGDDPGSKAYVAGKHRDCAEVGIESIRIDLPATAPAPEIIAAIAELNSAPTSPATSCSCRCRTASTRTRCSSSSTRTRMPMACIR